MKREHTFSIIVLLFITLLMSCSIEFDGRTSIKKVFENSDSEKEKGNLEIIIKQDITVKPSYYSIEIKNSNGSVTTRKIECDDNEIDLTEGFDIEAGTYEISVKGYIHGIEVGVGRIDTYEFSGLKSSLTVVFYSENVEIPEEHNKKITNKDSEYHYWICDTCQETGKERHKFENKDGVYACSVCEWEEKIPGQNDHVWEHFDAEPSYCRKNGHKEYWRCSVHGEYTFDENAASGTYILFKDWKSKVSLPVDINNHLWSSLWEKDADGHWHECLLCNADEPLHTRHSYAVEKINDGKLEVLNVCRFCSYAMKSNGHVSPLKHTAAGIVAEVGTGKEWILNIEPIENEYTYIWKVEQSGNDYACETFGTSLLITWSTSSAIDLEVFCFKMDSNGNEYNFNDVNLLTLFD